MPCHAMLRESGQTEAASGLTIGSELRDGPGLQTTYCTPATLTVAAKNSVPQGGSAEGAIECFGALVQNSVT
jgi:hypothetical protein